jgi:hypothetical protein
MGHLLREPALAVTRVEKAQIQVPGLYLWTVASAARVVDKNLQFWLNSQGFPLVLEHLFG